MCLIQVHRCFYNKTTPLEQISLLHVISSYLINLMCYIWFEKRKYYSHQRMFAQKWYRTCKKWSVGLTFRYQAWYCWIIISRMMIGFALGLPIAFRLDYQTRHSMGNGKLWEVTDNFLGLSTQCRPICVISKSQTLQSEFHPHISCTPIWDQIKGDIGNWWDSMRNYLRSVCWWVSLFLVCWVDV